MTHASHPKDSEACPECGGEGFEKARRVKQIGMTYECQNCGTELYVYDNSEYDLGQSLTWAPAESAIQALGHERRCNDCGYEWHYGGAANRPTCPDCKGKNTEPVDI